MSMSNFLIRRISRQLDELDERVASISDAECRNLIKQFEDKTILPAACRRLYEESLRSIEHVNPTPTAFHRSVDE
ncbi:hypothetical protein THRCLA_22021 [Thraustotheca clavata]|uniref:Uncharacterized protein n=1 Tax=Thraustotheca clavata TaxID=74557 RepID=A0A1V9ZE66_9STRA|nr:hypothetical protein THRCLA_22021 [Thraustotheca clavata]